MSPKKNKTYIVTHDPVTGNIHYRTTDGGLNIKFNAIEYLLTGSGRLEYDANLYSPEQVHTHLKFVLNTMGECEEEMYNEDYPEKPIYIANVLSGQK